MKRIFLSKIPAKYSEALSTASLEKIYINDICYYILGSFELKCSVISAAAASWRLAAATSKLIDNVKAKIEDSDSESNINLGLALGLGLGAAAVVIFLGLAAGGVYFKKKSQKSVDLEMATSSAL